MYTNFYNSWVVYWFYLDKGYIHTYIYRYIYKRKGRELGFWIFYGELNAQALSEMLCVQCVYIYMYYIYTVLCVLSRLAWTAAAATAAWKDHKMLFMTEGREVGWGWLTAKCWIYPRVDQESVDFLYTDQPNFFKLTFHRLQSCSLCVCVCALKIIRQRRRWRRRGWTKKI